MSDAGRYADVDALQHVLDAETGFPIYVLFEVIHLSRKTAWDKIQEENDLI